MKYWIHGLYAASLATGLVLLLGSLPTLMYGKSAALVMVKVMGVTGVSACCLQIFDDMYPAERP